MASSPMKKSKSSVPRLDARKFDWEEAEAEANPVVAALEEVEERVAMAVGKMKDGESLPAKPSLVKPVPLFE
ncbi:hypothetical protein WICPIJ_006010 [Wickerhamomyces pijperi]|uniref:Uncharacterized protein n=1 Tax=Wickerhamomyces pijperi TaxID=599730 RepID=A0A9P8Q2U6_WICPI|nr:hypothetical protein WICPIJ_006010 [Wickerhamomyces pijperi]